MKDSMNVAYLVFTLYIYRLPGDAEIHTDGERNIGEGFVADLMDREYITLNKLPPDVRKQLRVKFDNRSDYFTVLKS